MNVDCEKCDFCDQATRTDRAFVYTASEIRLTHYAADDRAVVSVHFDGTWVACPPCRRLIDADDRAALLDRACQCLGADSAVGRATLQVTQSAFFHSWREAAA